MSMVLNMPITKIDVEKREVYGLIATEVQDKAGEVFDYNSSKPLFEKWTEEIKKLSEGKSAGNVRLMHKPEAVGKLTQVEFDDDNKTVSACAKIVDEDTWNKINEGVLTGFSIGGSYVRRFKEGGVMKYTAKPCEVSVVDNPCNSECFFQEIIKADGVETREINSFAVATVCEDTEVLEVVADKVGTDIPGIVEKTITDDINSLPDVVKAGGRHNKKDVDLIQKMHDHSCELGAVCNLLEGANNMNSEDLMSIQEFVGKTIAAHMEPIVKKSVEIEDQIKELTKAAKKEAEKAEKEEVVVDKKVDKKEEKEEKEEKVSKIDMQELTKMISAAMSETIKPVVEQQDRVVEQQGRLEAEMKKFLDKPDTRNVPFASAKAIPTIDENTVIKNIIDTTDNSMLKQELSKRIALEQTKNIFKGGY